MDVLQSVPTTGHVTFTGDIRTAEDARRFVESQMIHAHAVNASLAGNGPGILPREGSEMTLTPEQTRLIEEAKKRVEREVRTAQEIKALGSATDPVPNVFASTLGSSATMAGLMAATRGAAAPFITSLYKGAEYEELSLKYPEASHEARLAAATLSAVVQTAGDYIGVKALSGLNIGKLLANPQGLTAAIIARGLGRAAISHGAENVVEGVQDIATPAIINALKLDFPGFDWEQEKKDFWKSRADVAMGMLPLTLLGLGAASVQDYANSKALLSDNATLGRQGLPEHYRKSIIEAAQRGDTATAQRLLQEGFKQRDPAIAAEFQDAMDAEHETAQPVIPENTTQSSSGSAQPPAPVPETPGQPSQTTANESQPTQTSSTPTSPPSGPPLDVETSRKLITNVEEIQKHRPLNPVEKADLDQARQVVAEHAAKQAQPSGPPPNLQTAQARIHNIMNRPPEQRGHPTTKADLKQAQQVVAAQVQKLESQTTPLSEAQQEELAEAKAVLARLVPETNSSLPYSPDAQEDATTNTNATTGPQLPFAPSPNLEWHVPHDPARHLSPDKPFDAVRKPTKPPKVLSKDDTDEGNIRGCKGENETAEVLAQNGYAYEQVAQNRTKLPDGTWAGKADGVFGKAPNSKSDVYSPAAQTNLRNIYDTVVGKVERQKSPYVVVRLEPGGQSIEDITRKFHENPIEGLKQLFVVKEGKLYIIY